MSNPRQEFVEAVGWLRRHGERYTEKAIYLDDLKWLRRACIAFVDAWCDSGDIGACGRYKAGIDGTRGDLHTRCRAALLRDCGLEKGHGEDGEGD